MLTDSRKRIFCLLPSEKLILSHCPLRSLSASDPISVLQSALTLQIEPLGTELRETNRPLHSSDYTQVSDGLCLITFHASFEEEPYTCFNYDALGFFVSVHTLSSEQMGIF